MVLKTVENALLSAGKIHLFVHPFRQHFEFP